LLAPAPDQIEVSLFGPGFGECSLIHLGGGKWVVIDSCIDSRHGSPSALVYLHSLGIDPAKAIQLVIATHWHADHIKGLAEVLRVCPDAMFCSSSAYTANEFLASVLPYELRNTVAGGSGVEELAEILHILDKRCAAGSVPLKASPNRLIKRVLPEQSGHGKDCFVWTLSPSDKQVEKFFAEIGAMMPQVQSTKHRATSQDKNHVAVVTWIEIGEVKILLGADLEETSDADTGWSVIVSSRERPAGKATIFKVPHHGSVNAHSDDVWDNILVNEPFAIITPFNRGAKKLPSKEDVKRIAARTPNSYLTASTLTKRTRRERPYSVVKTIRDRVGRIREAERATGCVRLRNGGNTAPQEWNVELFNGAYQL